MTSIRMQVATSDNRPSLKMHKKTQEGVWRESQFKAGGYYLSAAGW